MTNPLTPQGYRETGVVTEKKLMQAEATLEWLESNAFRFEGNPQELIKAARAEVTRMRGELEEVGHSETESVIQRIKGRAKDVT